MWNVLAFVVFGNILTTQRAIGSMVGVSQKSVSWIMQQLGLLFQEAKVNVEGSKKAHQKMKLSFL